MKLKITLCLLILCCLSIADVASKKNNEMLKLLNKELNRGPNDIEIVAPGGAIKLYNNTDLEPVKNVPIKKLYGSVYWEGWIKYYHYLDDPKLERPTQFYDNPEYDKQRPLKDNYMENDGLGRRRFIPDKQSFWAKLLSTGNLNIFTSRINENDVLAHTIENLNTNLINYVIPSNNANGAVQDLGEFLEGSCISISIKRPPPPKASDKVVPFNSRTGSGTIETWIICTKDRDEKNNLMQYLISQKIKHQEDLDDVLEEVNRNVTISKILVPTPTGPVVDRYMGPDKSPYDGYWILLSDWSECSLKCGGGTTTQQWVCIPPTGTGKPCIGEAVRRKSCNEQACPGVVKDTIIPKNDATHVTLQPIYKALPFSSRPQQFIKCVIKENDVFYKTTDYDPNKLKAVSVPGRIIMNTNVISVFKDESYNTALFTFSLQDSVFSKSSTDKCCFFISNADRRFELCGFSNNCDKTIKRKKTWVDEWAYDFEFFQKKCGETLKTHELAVKFGDKANPKKGGANIGIDPANTLTEAQKEIVDGRKNLLQKEIESNVQKQIDNKVNQAEKVSMVALRREINFEDLIKNEEVQKGREETQALVRQVAQEKKKKKLLEQAFQMREQNFEKLRVNKDTEKKVDNIKQEVLNEISFKRGELKKKIADIRKKYKRKQRQLQQQIQMIRSQMANDIMTANKKGETKKCLDTRTDINAIKTYCDSNFPADFNKNTSCKEIDSFCYSCCEGEFGNLYLQERDECYNACDQSEKKELEDGDWVWTGGQDQNPTAPPPSAPPTTPSTNN